MSKSPDFFERYPQFFDTSRAGTRLAGGEISARLSNRYKAIIQSNLFSIRDRRILDIASHDGRWTLAALDAGAAHVTAVEPRESLVSASNEIIAGAGFGADRYTAIIGDIFDVFQDFEEGQFDTIFCLGFFYHTMEHFRLMKNMLDLKPDVLILDTVAHADNDPKVVIAEEDPEWEGASIAITGNSEVVLKGVPTVGYIQKIVTHMGWNGHEIDWHTLGIEDWRGSENYKNRSRRTFVIYPDKEKEIKTKAPATPVTKKTVLNSSDWEPSTSQIIKEGIAVAPRLFKEEADYLLNAYIDNSVEPQISVEEGVVNVSEERGATVGNPVWKYVSLTDPVLQSIVLSPELLTLIHSYYGTQPYLRRMPFIKQNSMQKHHDADISSVYHIDQSKHFVSVMLLLSDLTENDSHMRFLAGTHQIEQPDFRLQPNDPKNKDLEEELLSKYDVVPLVGPKGTMFIYDNGNGIHKGHMSIGTTRNVMQATFSRGDHITKPRDLDLLGSALKDSVSEAPSLVREAITKIL